MLSCIQLGQLFECPARQAPYSLHFHLKELSTFLQRNRSQGDEEIAAAAPGPWSMAIFLGAPPSGTFNNFLCPKFPQISYANYVSRLHLSRAPPLPSLPPSLNPTEKHPPL